MTPIDASTAQCLIFTYKEGLLSRVAHDLKLQVEDFTVEGDLSTAVHARFDARSIRAVCAMKGDKERPMSAKDLRDIDGNTQSKVLETSRHPDILFDSTSIKQTRAGLIIDGDLTLHGVRRPIRAIGQRQGDQLIVTAELHQPEFRIKPFSAAFGAIKLQPRVSVRLVLPSL